jgi:hypothetical protein
MKEASVYASIRQAKAKTGMAARRIKDGAIPIISDLEGLRAYYVVYAPDDTVTAISISNDYAGAEESNRRVLGWIEQSLSSTANALNCSITASSSINSSD